MHLDVFLRYCHHLFRDTTDQSCHGVLQRDANKLSSENRWQNSFAAAVGAKPCRIRRGIVIRSPQRPRTTVLPYHCHTYHCNTNCYGNPPSTRSCMRLAIHSMGGNPHIPLLLDPENGISRRHGKTQGFGMIYEQNVCFTTAPEVMPPCRRSSFLGGSPRVPPPFWQQNARIFS